MAEIAIITCPIHGDFEETPIHHLSEFGGCPKYKEKYTLDKQEDKRLKKAVKLLERIKNERPDFENYDLSKFIETYNKDNNTAELKCLTHNTVFYPNINFFLKGSGCYHCGIEKQVSSSRKTNDDFIKESKAKFGDRFIYKTNYIDNNAKILFLDTLCGHEYWQLPRNHLLGSGCTLKQCIAKRNSLNSKTKLTHDEYNIKQNKVHNNEYLMLSNYTQAHSVIKLKHLPCGHIFERSANSHIRGTGCPNCGGSIVKSTKKKTHETFENTMKDLYGDYYTILDKYVNSDTPVRVKNNICSHTFNIKPKDISNGLCCPICNLSKKEKEIFDFLTLKNIKFISQKRFKDCLNAETNYTLPFDFYLPDYNLCIEYDGKQHFEPTDFTGRLTEEEKLYNLKDLQKRDEIKNKYCEEKGIRLIRISYLNNNKLADILNNCLQSNK